MNRRLLWTLVAALGLAAAPAATDTGQGSPAATRLALVGGMLLDGHDAPPIHHAAILIEGDRIVRAGPSRDVTIPRRHAHHRHQRPDDDARDDRAARAPGAARAR